MMTLCKVYTPLKSEARFSDFGFTPEKDVISAVGELRDKGNIFFNRLPDIVPVGGQRRLRCWWGVLVVIAAFVTSLLFPSCALVKNPS